MKILNKKAISVVEYTILFVIIMGAFLVMNHYIQRGVNGKWAQAGQGFAFGRQYDPQKTIECSFDPQSSQWYDRNCYEYYIVNKDCHGDPDCEEGIMNSTCAASSKSSCDQLNHGALP
jgi:hypothetical protein